MSQPWYQRKKRLRALLSEDGDEDYHEDDDERDDTESLTLDRLLHMHSGGGKTSKMREIEDLQFSDKDLNKLGTLAMGQFGLVDLVRCRLDNCVYVCKKIQKKLAIKTREQCSPQVERDILLLATRTDSQWAPHLLCAFQDETHLSLVMQYAEAGTLWDVVESSPDKGRISEADLLWWLPQCIRGIHWCHQQGFVHRDIKPHNFVITNTSHVLLTDFGSAAPLLPADHDGVQLVPKRYCLVPCGTCDYISPEVLQAHEDALVALEMSDGESAVQDTSDMDEGVYGRETDWWSLGAMLYEMSFGVAPFFANDIGQTYLRIMQHENCLKFDRKVHVSHKLLSFIRRLLCNNARRLGRHGVEELISHSLFDDVDWANLHVLSAPPNLHLPQFTYSPPPVSEQSSPVPSHDTSLPKPFDFTALFQSSPMTTSASPGMSFLHTTPTVRNRLSNSITKVPVSFIGFSWGPSLHAFDNPLAEPSQVFPTGTQRTTSLLSTPYTFNGLTPKVAFATPMRSASLGPPCTAGITSTIRRTVKGTLVERRPVSDREAMKQLVSCVGMSARKRVLESGRKPRILRDTVTPLVLQRRQQGQRRSSTSRAGPSTATTSSFKELRFDSVNVPDLVIDTASTSCASSDTEEVLSPSPSPRPGSAMSGSGFSFTRRSGTPTATLSGSFPFTTFSQDASGMRTDTRTLSGRLLNVTDNTNGQNHSYSGVELEVPRNTAAKSVAVVAPPRGKPLRRAGPLLEGGEPGLDLEAMERRLSLLRSTISDLEKRLLCLATSS